jgi:hypothetical protein
MNCPDPRTARIFSSSPTLLIETVPVQDNEERDIGTRGFIENLSTTYGTQLRHRTKLSSPGTKNVS